MRLAFVTVCRLSELDHVELLRRSLENFYSEFNFCVWHVDKGKVPAQFKHISPKYVADIISYQEFGAFVSYLGAQVNIELDRQYALDICKIAAAVKLLDDGYDRVIVLEYDSLIYSRLIELEELLASSPMVLIPNVVSENGLDMIDQAAVDGLYTFTIFGVSRAGKKIIDDVRNRIWKTSLRSTDRRLESIARIFSTLPLVYNDIAVLKHTGYGVGFWNIGERQLNVKHRNLYSGEDELRHICFRGLYPKRADIFAKDPKLEDITSTEPLHTLIASYKEQFDAVALDWPVGTVVYDYVRFDNGLRFDNICEQLLREAYEHGLRFGRPLKSDGGFLSWIAEREPGSRLPRYLKALYRRRPEIAQMFPFVESTHYRAYLEWVVNYAVIAERLEPGFLDYLGIVRSIGRQEEIDYSLPGVNYLGLLRSEVGLGEAARGNIRALKSQGCPISIVDVSEVASSRAQDTSLEENAKGIVEGLVHDISILHVNPDYILLSSLGYKRDIFFSRFNIGYWAWETLEFPQELHEAFKYIDEVWVATDFMARAIGRYAPCPVVVIPHVVEVPDNVRPNRQQFGLRDDEYIFLYTFDVYSGVGRKNPLGAILAFKKAFDPSEPARLVLKSMHFSEHPKAYQELKSAAEGANITFLDGTLERDASYSLMASCDAYVSLHRAEGFGLTLAEAMLLGKPVIATGWSGNMEFMNVNNSFPVKYQLRRYELASWPYKEGTLWAEPDIDHAASIMRQLYENRRLGIEIGQAAKNYIMKYHNEEFIGRLMVERLHTIRPYVEAKIEERRKGSLKQSATKEIKILRKRNMALAALSSLVKHPEAYLREVPDAIEVLLKGGLVEFTHKLREKLTRVG